MTIKTFTITKRSSTLKSQENDISEFRSTIWSNKIEHREGTWLNEIKYDGQGMKYEQITTEDVQRASIKTNNWKTPSPDHIQNYWWKRFTASHPYLAKQLSRLIAKPEETPHFFTEGNTYLIPKDLNDCTNPRKYRSIMCLPTIYKINFVSVIKHTNTYRKDVHATQ